MPFNGIARGLQRLAQRTVARNEIGGERERVANAEEAAPRLVDAHDVARGVHADDALVERFRELHKQGFVGAAGRVVLGGGWLLLLAALAAWATISPTCSTCSFIRWACWSMNDPVPAAQSPFVS